MVLKSIWGFFLLTLSIVLGIFIQVIALVLIVILERICSYLRDLPLLHVHGRLSKYYDTMETHLNNVKFQVSHVNAWLRLSDMGHQDPQTNHSMRRRNNGAFGLHQHIIRLKSEIMWRDQAIEAMQKVIKRVCNENVPEKSLLVYEQLLSPNIFDLLLKFHRERRSVINERKNQEHARQELLASQVMLGKERVALKSMLKLENSIALFDNE